MWDKVVTLYENYIGTGMIAGLFLVALIYLFFSEKNKTTRIVFLYMPVIVLVLYFCPFFATVVYAFADEEIYYRLLWLVPIVPVLAYAAIKLIISIQGKKRIVVGVAVVGMIMVSGKLVYTSPYFSVAQNPYHVPEAVVQICDEIEEEGAFVMAAFPMEFIQYVRQYSGNVRMPYGRDVLVERWKAKDELYDLMNENVLRVAEIAEVSKAKGVHYLVFSAAKQLDGDFLDYGFKLIGEFEGYLVYQDVEMYETYMYYVRMHYDIPE